MELIPQYEKFSKDEVDKIKSEMREIHGECISDASNTLNFIFAENGNIANVLFFKINGIIMDSISFKTSNDYTPFYSIKNMATLGNKIRKRINSILD